MPFREGEIFELGGKQYFVLNGAAREVKGFNSDGTPNLVTEVETIPHADGKGQDVVVRPKGFRVGVKVHNPFEEKS